MILSRHVRFADLIKLTRCTCLVRPVLLAPASGSTHIEGGSVYAPTVAARAPRLRASGVLPIVIATRGTPPRVVPYPGNALTPQAQTLPKRRLQFPAVLMIWRPPTKVETRGLFSKIRARAPSPQSVNPNPKTGLPGVATTRWATESFFPRNRYRNNEAAALGIPKLQSLALPSWVSRTADQPRPTRFAQAKSQHK